MDQDDIFRTSFQSLRLLDAVYRDGSVTAAAERFGMNQSSVSTAIDRLREVFGDPLFVRAGRGIEPTARCGRIVERVRGMIEEFEELSRAEAFEAATSEQRFTLSCNYHERSVILPELLRKLQARAPGIRLRVVQANVSAVRQLREGLCDLAISPVGPERQGIHSSRLFTERYVCFADPAHPAAGRGLTLSAYGAARHIQVAYDGAWQPFYRTHLERLGVNVEPVIEVPSVGAVEYLVAGTELVLTAPEMLRRVLEPTLICLNAPFDCRFDEYMLWTEKTDASAPHRWLRDLVVETVTGLTG